MPCFKFKWNLHLILGTWRPIQSEQKNWWTHRVNNWHSFIRNLHFAIIARAYDKKKSITYSFEMSHLRMKKHAYDEMVWHLVPPFNSLKCREEETHKQDKVLSIYMPHPHPHIVQWNHIHWPIQMRNWID